MVRVLLVTFSSPSVAPGAVLRLQFDAFVYGIDERLLRLGLVEFGENPFLWSESIF